MKRASCIGVMRLRSDATSGRKLAVVGLLTLVGVAFGTATLPAQAQGVIRACVQKSSLQVRIISEGENCRSTEVLLQWNIQGPQGAQGPQGPSGSAALTVYDGNNLQVGNVVGLLGHTFPIVVLHDGSTPFTVNVAQNRLAGGVNGLYFDGAGCTGTAYIQASAASFNGRMGPLPATAVFVAPGGGFDVYMPDGGPMTVKTMSRIDEDGTCFPDGATGTNRSVNTVATPIHLSFVAPFTVQ